MNETRTPFGNTIVPSGKQPGPIENDMQPDAARYGRPGPARTRRALIRLIAMVGALAVTIVAFVVAA